MGKLYKYMDKRTLRKSIKFQYLENRHNDINGIDTFQYIHVI